MDEAEQEGKEDTPQKIEQNKKLVEDFFRRERDGIKIGRKSTKAAIGYYKTMSKTAVVAPQFMDSKK